MRVIAGSARGRRLFVPPGLDVRPTKDRVREAVFSALDARGLLVGASVLDLYAGSGALGIEALSRGADSAVFVEQHRPAADAIAQNVESLGFDATRVVCGSVHSFLQGARPNEALFDLVFADPPYDTTDAAAGSVLTALAESGWLSEDAFVSLERPRRAALLPPPELQVVWERTFGDTLIVFLTAA